MECLKYAHTTRIINGCNCNINTGEKVTINGYFLMRAYVECLKYACDNKCPRYEFYISY